MKQTPKSIRFFACLLLAVLLSIGCFAGCAGNSEKQVVIYSNADDEAVESMKKTLDENGFAGKYIFQSFGTSGAGRQAFGRGKRHRSRRHHHELLLFRQQPSNSTICSKPFPLPPAPWTPFQDFYAPFIGNQGALLINTEVLKQNNLSAPSSVKDLANPEYAGMISVVDIQGSSTAWLMIQSLVDAYGEDGAKEILTGIYKNAGAHLEQSGSAPIKKVRAGEVAIGFGLRHQAVADKAQGLPIVL